MVFYYYILVFSWLVVEQAVYKKGSNIKANMHLLLGNIL